jgi:hypothetical protein
MLLLCQARWEAYASNTLTCNAYAAVTSACPACAVQEMQETCVQAPPLCIRECLTDDRAMVQEGGSAVHTFALHSL